MRKPKWQFRTELKLDGVWICGPYFTRISKAKTWLKHALAGGWEARYERVKP